MPFDLTAALEQGETFRQEFKRGSIDDRAWDDTRAWVADQVEQYVALQPRYQRFADTLELVLRRAADNLAPLAIVQTRSKSVSSFAEKCLRKRAQGAGLGMRRASQPI